MNILDNSSSICIIIAHPDDETLFFTPLIKHICEKKVYLLSLTNGNYYGFGKEREKELIKACDTLGIKKDHVKIVQNDSIQDQPTDRWPLEVVINEIESYIDENNIDTIVTFDEFGISKHINHISINEAIRMWLKESKRNSYPQIYTLLTSNILIKYSGIFSLLYSFLFKDKDNVVIMNLYPLDTLKALLCHRTQVTWYRIIFSLFSQYNYLNILRKLNY